MFALIADHIVDLLPQGGSQCFPFYVYDEDGSNRRENITDWALSRFRAHYADETITKWDIFYYVYGVLHHPDYRARYADNLKRDLPRIPFVPLPHPLPASGEGGFWVFAKAGRELAEWHLNYETVEPYALAWVYEPTVAQTYRVEKMRVRRITFASPQKERGDFNLRVNEWLTLVGIPAAVQDYRLGNRSALDWVIDQYQITTDKRSGITHDPNRRDDPRYIVNLVGRVIRVSLETVRIVEELAQAPLLGE